jgi:trypsin-like peptidase
VAESRGWRCGELFVERDEGIAYGSCYQLASSLVLTAAHVVTEGKSVRVRFLGGGHDEVTVAGRVAWRGQRVDLALVELSWPGGIPEHAVEPTAIGVIPDDAEGRIPFTSIGFPRHRMWSDSEATWRDSDQLDGMIPLGSSVKRGRLMLHRDDGRKLEARDWSGFSGAAILCDGLPVGAVIIAEKTGALEGVRLASALGTFESRIDTERERPENTSAARALLAQHGVQSQVLRMTPPAVIRRAAYWSRLENYAARCPALSGRGAELAALAAFAAGTEIYQWLVAPPWAGKTALVTHFAVHPPPGVDIVAFVVSRRDGETRIGQFRRSVCGQLAALLGDYAPAEPETADLFVLWEQAATTLNAQERSLVLVIDGLDENDFQDLGEPSIASQLPQLVPPGAHVLVTSRPVADPPTDVDQEHPLRRCRRVFMDASPVGGITRLAARQELERVLADVDQRRILTAIAVARGPLTARDLEDVVHVDRLRARRFLEGSLSRVVEPRSAGRGNSQPYALAHDTLAETVRNDLDSDEIAEARAAIDAWADGLRERGWPDETPAYLLEAYPTLLAAERDTLRLARLASPARHDMLRRRTAGDRAALTELSDAARLLVDQPTPDLVLLTRVAFLRTALKEDIRGIPAEYVIAVARLGRVEQAVQMARSRQDPRALLGVAHLLAGLRPEEAAGLALEAAQIRDGLDDEVILSVVESEAVLSRCGDDGALDRARSAIDSFLRQQEDDDIRAWAISGLVKAAGEIDEQLARRLVDEAIDLITADERPVLLAEIADTLVDVGMLDRLYEYAAQLDADRRRSMILGACDTLFSRGGPAAIPPGLRQALQTEWLAADTGLVHDRWPEDAARAAAYVEAELAEPMLAAALRQLPDTEDPSRLGQDIYRSLATHGKDPRTVSIDEHAERDYVLAGGAQAARLSGHLTLARTLASELADPQSRADELAGIALSFIEAGDEASAESVLEATAASIADVPSSSRPLLLAELAAAAADVARTDIAESARQAAVASLQARNDDYLAQNVAGVLASRGWLEAVERLAVSRSDPDHHADVLLHAAGAVADNPGQREKVTALIDAALPQAEEIPADGRRDRVLTEISTLLVQVGRPGEALEVLRRTSTQESVTELRALLALGRQDEALSLMWRAADRDGESAAHLAVEAADAGLQEIASEVVAALLAEADPDATATDGIWPHPWLALACQLTGREETAAEFCQAAASARLIAGGPVGWSSAPADAIVRLGMWEQYRRDAATLNAILADGALTDLIDQMLDAGLFTATLRVINDLGWSLPRYLGKAAAVAFPLEPALSRQLVARSLAADLTPDVIRPLAALDAQAVAELAGLLDIACTPNTTDA